ncbi:apses transcription factor [Aspergillus campestris IBT 28561]|uniref:Cell pattern formation-associated protein stuA n=1 Tax=Aspergillus campestris (strain IBT 28561) TaxID=1392248 RepID=A0A2I1D1B3_ASPC2|nr:apses transcription factor [Aspergillus campestris IBT 28561]PKY03664.1 apses transcription factor [Aspergillus campestris IBT 28561]
MVRSLPKKNNPLIQTDGGPAYEELLMRRRLGKTNLAVKATQIGTSNATRPENLGPFEYAHLRAPLPKDLKGSEIFPSHAPAQHPETYFLMRRSKDGFVSATGMFKIAFPWAKLDEERSEREYLKAKEGTSEDEVAGNVWISPILALELAKEYKMYDWVRALLDPAEIVQSPSSQKKLITPPPRFDLPPIDAPVQFSVARSRTRRSASPSKYVGSPRKSRQTKAQKEASAAATSEANANLQSSLDMTASTADSESLNGILPSVEDVEEKTTASPKKSAQSKSKKSNCSRAKREAVNTEDQTESEKTSESVRVEVENPADGEIPVRTTQTTVPIDMPITLPEAPSAAETEKMIAEAKQMVQEVVDAHAEDKATGEPSSAKAGKVVKKRKPEDLSDDEEDEEAKTLRTKRARVLEDKLKRERVRNRALVGVTAAFAFAASIPYFF